MSPPIRALTSISRGRPSTRRISTCCTPSVIPEGLDRSSGGRGDLGQERVGGIDGVAGLVEVRCGAQVLAGHGDRSGRAAVGDALDRDFRPVEVLLDQDAGVLAAAARTGRGEREGGGQFFGPVDADHADAAGERGGLDDGGVAEGHRRQAGLQQGPRLHRGGRRHPVAGEQGPGGGLVAAGPHHLDGRRGQTERAGEAGGGDEVPLVPGDHAGEVVALGQRPAGRRAARRGRSGRRRRGRR